MKVLVVIDMQNDFITGPLGTPEARAIVPSVQKKVDEAIKNGNMVVYTRDTHQENYLETMEGKKLPVKHCIEDTVGWEIADDVLPTGYVENVYFVNKPTFGDYCLPGLLSAFADSNCGLNYGDEIELIGVCTDICVISNALLLKAHFYSDIEISVDATCCAGVTPETHEAALKTMEMCQINVKR